MFEKFTEGAIKVIMLSQEEARRMGHKFVGTEQLLLGVIGQRHGIGAQALKRMRVTLKKARKEIELYIGRGTGYVGSDIPFTPRAKRVLEIALLEGSPHNYKNELEVEVNFDEVDTMDFLDPDEIPNKEERLLVSPDGFSEIDNEDISPRYKMSKRRLARFFGNTKK